MGEEGSGEGVEKVMLEMLCIHVTEILMGLVEAKMVDWDTYHSAPGFNQKNISRINALDA